MGKATAYLAFDLGASSGRAMLGWIEPGGPWRLEELHRFPNGPLMADGGCFWDIHALFEHVRHSLELAGRCGAAIRSVGIDTWGVDFALLDGDGQLLERPRCYREARNAGLSRRVAERIGPERLQTRTGSMFQDHASLCQLLAARLHTPRLLERARRLLFIPDLLRHWLCGGPAGAVTADVTFASTSQMYDVPRREWAVDILRELDLPHEILPRVQVGAALVGRLSAEIGRQTGLGELPVVAGAGHDTGAAFGICRSPSLPPPEDLVVISSGTWAILGIFVDAQLPPGSLDPRLFGYEANPDGSLRIVRNLTGGWLIEQCRRLWSARGLDIAYGSLIAAARASAGRAEASAIIDAQSEGFINPPDMPAAIADYCRSTGQQPPRTVGDFTQVIFASLADSYARSIQTLREKTGRRLSKLYMIGGMARNEYLNELTAARAGVDVLVGPAEATTLGNLAVQLAAGA